MSSMFVTGFLGTKAPLFMDIVTLIVAFLPLLIGLAISFARQKNYRLHHVTHTVLFIVSLLVIGYFEYGVRLGGGYEAFVQHTQVSHDYLFIVLMIHIFISVVTMGVWASTLLNAYKSYQRGGILPGVDSSIHKKAGLRAFIGITLTSLTGIWVYLLLFVF